MTVLLHLSDTHFGTEQPEVVEALVRLAVRLRPQLVVLSGDITQRARAAQFRAARRFVDRLDAPATLAIPGNHDIPLFNLAARLWAPYANYRRAFGTRLEPVHDADGLLVVCVNTTRAHRHKDGEVDAMQVRRVAERLRRARPEQLRIVVTHQPVHVTRPEDASNLLHGREDALRAWAEAGADLVLGGHIHLPYVQSLAGTLPGVSRAPWCVQAGTAVSRRVRDGVPNSVNVIRHDPQAWPRECLVERWDHRSTSGRFELFEATRIALVR